ncbi:hypothetical protein IFVP177_C260137 [Vibrio parahaemolyticus]
MIPWSQIAYPSLSKKSSFTRTRTPLVSPTKLAYYASYLKRFVSHS